MGHRTYDQMPPMALAWVRALLPKPAVRAERVPRVEGRVASCRAEPRWVARYCEVTGTPPGPTLPPGAPQALALPLHMAVLTAPELSLPLLGIVHVRQRIDVVRPLGADEAAAVRCWVEGAQTVRRGVEVELHTAWEVAGETPWHGVTTFLVPSRARRRGPSRVSDTAAQAPDLAATWPLPEDLGRRFAQVAGDRNPIHLHRYTARPFGFPRPIIHGMWTLARSLAALGDRAPAAGVRIECAFRRPLSLPGMAAFTAWRGGDNESFAVLDAAGKVAVTGSVAPL